MGEIYAELIHLISDDSLLLGQSYHSHIEGTFIRTEDMVVDTNIILVVLSVIGRGAGNNKYKNDPLQHRTKESISLTDKSVLCLVSCVLSSFSSFFSTLLLFP